MRWPIVGLAMLLAFGAGGAAGFVVSTSAAASLRVSVEQAKRPEDTVMVIVHAADAPPGVRIRNTDLYAIQIPPRYLPPGVFLSPEKVVGRRPRHLALSNEFARSGRLFEGDDSDAQRDVLEGTLRNALAAADPDTLLTLAEATLGDPLVSEGLAAALASQVQLPDPSLDPEDPRGSRKQQQRYVRWCEFAKAGSIERWTEAAWARQLDASPRLAQELKDLTAIRRCVVEPVDLTGDRLDTLLVP